MRFLHSLALLPALTLSSPASGSTSKLQEYPSVDGIAFDSSKYAIFNLAHFNSDKVDAAGAGAPAAQTQAVCPPGFPLYCSAYGYCCPANAAGCCPKSCCGQGTTFCYNGNCYGPA